MLHVVVKCESLWGGHDKARCTVNMTTDCCCLLGPGIVCWGLLFLVAFQLQLQKTVIILPTFISLKNFVVQKKGLDSGLE